MKKYKFKAQIQAGERGGAYIVFPFDTERTFGTKGKIPVEVTFDGVHEKTNMFRWGFPQHLIGMSKAIREQIGKKPGDFVEVALWKDEAARTIEIPLELKRRMEQEKLLPFFENLSYTHRKEYCRWISEAKKEETRQSRLTKAIEMLRKGIKTPG